MPQARRSGTAWARKLDDYDYARNLDRPGWAWEFLRRNEHYRCDWRTSEAELPLPIRHVSGAIYLRLRRRFPNAEAWGLVTFGNPVRTADKTPVFWHPDATNRMVRCSSSDNLTPRNPVVALDDFRGVRQILICGDVEYLIVRDRQISARLEVHGPSLLVGPRSLTFNIEGLNRLGTAVETLQLLSSLRNKSYLSECDWGQTELRLRECLVALDGHLEDRSYRDIAQVLYGPDRVAETWTSSTRFMKDKVRRAVERGIELMNGEYRKLLA